ncbi:MAG: arylsulfotransferase family protein, partial [Bacteroidota bacterium]
INNMMKKVLKTFALIVIFLFILSVFGWMSHHISKGNKDFGFLTEPIKFMYTFPDMFAKSVEEVKTLPKTFVETPQNFEPVNKLDSDLKVLITYSGNSDSRTIALLNLKNDSVHYQWTVDNPYEVTDRIKNPLMFPEKELVYSFAKKPLRRIDSLSNIIWKQDNIRGHHAMELDYKGDIWVCTYNPFHYSTAYYKLNGRSVFFKDNFITKVDAETGKILFHKSIAEILKENNVANYVLKPSGSLLDPLHHNDIEPAMKTTPYYNKDDVFISLRQPSIVLHYRPKTNELIDIIEGPFISQHDVDFLNDTTLIMFNNNYYTKWSKESKPPPKDSTELINIGDFYSNIVKYNLVNGKFSYIGDSIFRANRIFTSTEGLQVFLDDSTFFVEEQNSGIIWVLTENKVIYKNVLKSQHKGYHHLSNWTRIVDYE